MAKGGLTGPILIGGGVVVIAGVAYWYLSKEGTDLSKLLDFKWITDWLDNLLGTKPKEEPPKDGDGNGKEPPKDGDGKEPKPKPGDKEPPPPTGGQSSSIVIGAAGDWGSARNSNWKKVTSVMKSQKIQLALGLGDYSYSSADKFKPVVDDLKKSEILFKGAQGNHDSSDYAKLFGQSSMLYSFSTGPAVIIILNTESGAGANVAFAEKVLKATKQQWKIMIMHKPLYTNSSKHGAERSLASALKPVINKYKVQLVMYSHNHNYQRIVLPDHPNTVFICSGTGGESHYGLKGGQSGTKKTDDSNFGFTKISINGSNLKGQFISTGNKVIDSWSQTATGKTSAYTFAYPAELEPIGMRISI